MPRKSNHNARILADYHVPRNVLKPGMIIRFSYTTPNSYDKRPVVFVTWIDRKTNRNQNLIHGINLNYLNEGEVQKFFENISKAVQLGMDDEELDDGQLYTKVYLPEGMLSGKAIYNTVIKPKLLKVNSTSNCYRSYKALNMKSVGIVNYRLNIIENEIRKDAELSRYAVKSAEFYKALLESGKKIIVGSK